MGFELLESVQEFLDSGGQVLFAILLLTILMWSLIFERFWYLNRAYPAYSKSIVDAWKNRTEHSSWFAHKIREKIISDAAIKLNQYIPLINTLVTLCPLLGLLGTVTGMIAVFDVMAVAGTGNARMMASGISMATIPTMAGMVASLSALYFGSLLKGRVEKEKEKLADRLEFN